MLCGPRTKGRNTTSFCTGSVVSVSVRKRKHGKHLTPKRVFLHNLYALQLACEHLPKSSGK